jgi:hypothetical protein
VQKELVRLLDPRGDIHVNDQFDIRESSAQASIATEKRY